MFLSGVCGRRLGFAKVKVGSNIGAGILSTVYTSSASYSKEVIERAN